MSRKFDRERDPYTFSLRGISTIASFVAPTAIEIDRMNRARDARLSKSPDAESDTVETPERADGDGAADRPF